ncbi:phage tail spike protein [Peptoniphilus sp. HCN-40583]|uniref:phage tail spike protein n=1 Tax=Peptoniphilus sp. HCN-40583 TaxID=3134662 RepID=UPI0030C2C91F
MIYVFDKNDDFIANLASSELLDATQDEGINTMDELSIEIKAAAREKLSGAMFLAHEAVDDPERFRYYKIITAENTDAGIAVRAIAAQFDELSAYGYLREYRRENATAAEAASIVFGGSRWDVISVDDTPQRAFYIYDLTRLEALKKLVETYNVELKFAVEIEKNKITRRTVEIHNRLGQDTNKRFYYGTNALKVTREESQEQIVTAVIGRGRGEEKFSADGEATGGFGRRINFKDVEWRKADGKPLDKPKGQEYIELPEATARYGYSDGTPRFKIQVHDQIDDPAELLQACYSDLIRLSRPLVQFAASVVQTGPVSLGDGVQIIRRDLDIFYTARVFKIKRNLLNAALTEIELGDNLAYGQADRNREIVNQIGSLNERVTEVAKSANLAFNQVFVEMREGLKNSALNQDGYNYELRAGNEYGLPAGYYSFNAPIDKNPTKVIYVGAGTMAIANRKDSGGKWDWKTFGTGDGILAEAIVGRLGEFASVNANQITVNNEFGTTPIGRVIGGKLKVLDDKIVDETGEIRDDLKLVDGKIVDLEGRAVIQDTLYNNVKITQAKGVQVLDNNNRERVQLGNWAADRYGLKLTDKTGARTVLDDEGILQSWQDGRCDNVDAQNPLKLHLYVPKETKRLYKAALRIYTEGFRAYSKATKGGGGEVPTTSWEPSKSKTSSSGGGDYGTTHGEADVSGSIVKVYVQSASGIDYTKWVEFWQTQSHEHRLNIDAHYHDFEIPGHDHTVRIDPHAHDIEYGIYQEYVGNVRTEIYINGSDRTSAISGGGYVYGDNAEMDMTNYLRTGWNEIQVRSNGRCRVDATVFIQALVQYAPM